MPHCNPAVRQDKLACGEAEVEGWVVKAIGRKLIDARVDQLQSTLTISRTAQRSFSSQDWGRLASQLGAWRVGPQRSLP